MRRGEEGRRTGGEEWEGAPPLPALEVVLYLNEKL